MQSSHILLRSTRRLTWAWVAISAATVTAAAVAAPSWRARPPTARLMMQNFAAEPLANDTLRLNERVFLEKASDNSREQVLLAQLAISQAGSSDIRSHAQQIVGDQRGIGEALSAIIRRKGAHMPTGAAASTGPQTYERLAEKAGADFDREFVRAMAERHDALIALFEQATADAKDADVRELAAAQLPTLRAHRNSILELKKIFD